MSALAQPRLTLEEYLVRERAAEFKSEFYAGQMYAMAGGSHRHARIIGNVLGELFIRLRKGRCAVYPGELRLEAGGLHTYPDVTVVCGEPEFADGEKDTLTNPLFLVEVLSPNTERHDRGLKAAQYRTIVSLQEYAFVSQDEPRVEVYTRQTSGGWLLAEFVGLEATCQFNSVAVSVPMADLYEKVTFGEEPA
jgi:Uma2 family endonuclease